MTEDAFLDLVIHHEGSAYTNHRLDRGGPTKFGVTLQTYSHWLGRTAMIAELKVMTVDVAKRIYRDLYLAPFAMLPEPLRENVADMGINAGQSRAVKLLQKAVGAKIDGDLGPRTLALVEDLDVREPLNEIFTGVRIAYYEDLILADPTQDLWRRGWRNRALSFVASSLKRIPRPSKQQSLLMAKAVPPDTMEVV